MTATAQESLGALHHPFSDAHLANPFPFYRQIRGEEPVCYSPEAGAWLVSRYQDVRAVLAQPELFSSGDIKRPMSAIAPATVEILKQGYYPMLPSAVNSDGLNHRRFREPYVKALVPERIAGYEAYMRQTCIDLLDSFAAARRFDVIADFASPLTLEIILHIIGIPRERMADAKQWGGDLMTLICIPLTEERQIPCAHGLVAFQRFIAELIAERQRAPREDLISEMISYQVPGTPALNTEELISALCGFLMAGQKTPIDMFGNGLMLLLDPIERWHELCAHPEQIPATIDEILRYDGPVHALSRTATADVVLGGVALPAGARLLLLCGSANRDEAQIPQADTFDPTRAPTKHVAFGHGSHYCVGAPLARLLGKVVFEELTLRLPNLHLVPQQRLEHVPALQFRGYRRIDVAW